MTGSVAIDVVIGLVFIYLLYSLLASLIAEIISTNLGLRAKNLHSAMNRMLNNDNVIVFSNSKDKTGIVKKIYDHPEIQSLSANKIFSKPSVIEAGTFSRALVDTLRNGKSDAEVSDIKEGIKSYALPGSIEEYLLNLVDEADDDLDKLRKLLSNWFNDTMSSASEWYKRNLQIMLFFIGLIIAWFFNLNIFKITQKLSMDQKARSEMVQLAIAYVENNPNSPKNYASLDSEITDEDKIYNDKMDTLSSIQKQLLKDIENTRSILGGGAWLPDSLVLRVRGESALPYYIESKLLPMTKGYEAGIFYYHLYGIGDKLSYALKMLFYNFLGYVITAIALSLGAPFWFNLLKRTIDLKKQLKN